jgi:hypothetical protein
MLRLAHVENAITIPIEAIVLHDRRQVVYVIDDSNHVHIRAVQVGIEGSKLAEITSGLHPGERVILGGHEKYQEGELVSPAAAPTPASETEQETGGTIDLKGGEQGGNQGDDQPSPAPQSPPNLKQSAKSFSGGAR